MDIEKIVAHYVALRDQKKDIEQAAKIEAAPIVQDMEQIEAALHAYMLDNELKALPTRSGTAYLVTATQTRCYDWDEVLEYVVKHQEYGAFERRVSKTWLQEQTAIIPGVELTSFTNTNIRRS